MSAATLRCRMSEQLPHFEAKSPLPCEMHILQILQIA
uniref:Uncharacterized protein n=1 Tax=Romanomermis culicivorax TaxID=13658 RepID=A0A915L6A9_ROMCU